MFLIDKVLTLLRHSLWWFLKIDKLFRTLFSL